MSRYSIIFLIHFMWALTAAIHGNAQLEKDSAVTMENVTVTATRKNTNIYKLPYSVEIIGRTGMDKQISRTIPEGLQGVPGLFIQKTSHGGGSPFVRGLTGNQSLILVDGIRLNNAVFRYGPNQYLTLVDPMIVDHIDVVKGTGSVQYGSDALGGVINVHTHDLRFQQKARWSSRLVSRMTSSRIENTWRPEVAYSGKKFAFVIGADSKSFGDLKGGDTTGFQRPSGYKEKAVDLKFKADLGKKWTMTFSNNWLAQYNVPVYHKLVLENFKQNRSNIHSRGFGYIRAHKKFNHPLFQQLEFFVSRQFIREERFSQKNGSDLMRFERDAVLTHAAGAELYSKFNSFWDANTGIEIYDDMVRSYRNDYSSIMDPLASKRGLYPDRSGYQQIAFYSLHHFQWKQLRIESGLRFNSNQIKIADPELGKVQVNPSALVYQGGISYDIFSKWSLYANFNQGFRAPNVDDLGTLGIVDFRYEIPSYNLKPEKSVNFEGGIKYSGLKTSVMASVFKNTISGLIARVRTGSVINGYDVYEKINIQKGYITGWESQFSGLIWKSFRVVASASYLYGQNISKSQPLRRIPPFNSRIGIEYFSANFKTGLVFDHASPQRRLEEGDRADNRIPYGGTPGFNLLHAYAGFEKGGVSTRLYLHNIFNQDYRTHGSGINGMGRAISLTTAIHFSHLNQ